MNIFIIYCYLSFKFRFKSCQTRLLCRLVPNGMLLVLFLYQRCPLICAISLYIVQFKYRIASGHLKAFTQWPSNTCFRMRPKPVQHDSSNSSTTASPVSYSAAFSSTAALSNGSSKPPKLGKYPSWSSISAQSTAAARHASTPTTLSSASKFSNHHDDHYVPSFGGGTNSSLSIFENALPLEQVPPIPANENGKRYSRDELLSIFTHMQQTGLISEYPPIQFASDSHKINGGDTEKATEESAEYKIFFAGALNPPELSQFSLGADAVSSLFFSFLSMIEI